MSTPAPTLRKLIDQAIEQIETYRYPDTRKVKERLHELLVVADAGSLFNANLEHLAWYKGELHIEASSFSRGCSYSHSYKLPVSVIDAENPLREAKLWGLHKKVSQAETNLREARSIQKFAEERLETAQRELAEVEGKVND